MRFMALAWLMVAGAASANEAPAIGPAPSWVVPQSFKLPVAQGTAPLRLLLLDEQAEMARGVVARYNETAMLVQTAAGLAAGNVALGWRPDFDTVTVHRLVVRRGDKTIDVLASGKKFAVIRRELNLENAVLDGRLTATLQIDGLEVGDVIDLAMTVVSRDPTLGNHVEAAFGQWSTADIDRSHVRAHWAKDVNLHLRSAGDLPPLKSVTDASGASIEFSRDRVEPLIFPRGAPGRFAIGRVVEASDFASWGEIASLMAPLYAKATLLDPGSDLTRQVDAIAAASPDPIKRASAALALVETKVRYLNVSMGDGGLVPRTAEETWKSRLGDCKAKTALLLAILRQLKVDAVPVLISTQHGDGLDQRLPLIALFDHVLVRATINGDSYWLDGTRPADTDIARLDVPNYRWGLALTGHGDRLAALIPSNHDKPDAAYALRIDARGGIYAPAPAEVVATFRGDTAMLFNQLLAAVPDSSRDAQLRDFFKQRYDLIEPAKVSASFDSTTGVETLAMAGTAHLKWDDGYLRIPGSGIAYAADFARTSGIDRDAPFAVIFPGFATDSATVLVPPGVSLWNGDVGHDIDQTLAGFHYRRSASLLNREAHMFKSEQAAVSEISAAAGRAAQARLRAINGEDVYLTIDDDYGASEADVKALEATEPMSASAFVDRGNIRLDRAQFADAIADFTKAHDLDPKDAWALADRALAEADFNQFVEAAADAAAADKLDPGNPVAARARAEVASRRGDDKGAIRELTLSLQREPDNGYSLFGRARLNSRLANFAAAETDLNRLLSLHPDHLEARLARANLFRAQNLEARTVAEADAITALPVQSDFSIAATAQIYVAVGQDAKALALLDRAIAAKPSALLYMNRTSIRPRADRAARIADYESGLRLAPDDEGTVWAHASFMLDDEKFTAAVTDATKLIAKDATEPQYRTLRGIAYARLGQVAAARADFDAADKLVKTAPTFNAMCYEMAIHNVELERALAICERAVALGPNQSAILDSRGFVKLRLGRLDAAIADFNAAILLVPAQSSSLYGRSLAYRAKGDSARADADRAAALKVERKVVERFQAYGLPAK